MSLLKIFNTLDACSITNSKDNLEKVKNTYDALSCVIYSSTPTLYNSGTMRPQLSSCYLLGMEEDKLVAFLIHYDCASISKWQEELDYIFTTFAVKGHLL